MELKIIGQTISARGGSNLIQYAPGKCLLIGGVQRMQDSIIEFGQFWTLTLPLKDGKLAGIWQQKEFLNQELYTGRSSQAATFDGVNKIYIFGGQQFTKNQSSDELFCIDLQEEKIHLLNQKNRPKGRNSHTLNYYNNQLYLFAGANENGPLNDFHIYDIERQEWKQIEEISQQISAREMHTSHIIKMNSNFKKNITDKSNKIIDIFKSNDNQEQVQNIKKYNIQIPDQTELSQPIQEVDEQQIQSLEQIQQIEQFQQLQQVQQGNQQQENKQEQQIEQQNLIEEQDLKDYLIVIGGRSGPIEFQSTIIAINLQNYKVEIFQQLPVPLICHTSTYVNDKLFIIGGFNGEGINDKIYCYKHQNLESTQQFNQLMASASHYVKEIDKIIVFGGCNLEGDSNTTFVIQP